MPSANNSGLDSRIGPPMAPEISPDYCLSTSDRTQTGEPRLCHGHVSMGGRRIDLKARILNAN